jgi:LmbE family N-acetylglucosaminyl deacetylase
VNALKPERIDRLLCLGAHGDDIEIGCGGTVLHLTGSHPDMEVCWVVFSASPTRKKEAARSADRFLEKASKSRVIFHDFRDGYLPYPGDPVKDRFEDLKKEFHPDLILTPSRRDRHQDHRFVAELTWNTYRDHLILEYEIPKWDGDMGAPNLYVPLSEEICRQKIDLILDSFPSQKGRDWFTDDLFLSILRIRGMECRSPSRYAEAFYASKLNLST